MGGCYDKYHKKSKRTFPCVFASSAAGGSRGRGDPAFLLTKLLWISALELLAYQIINMQSQPNFAYSVLHFAIHDGQKCGHGRDLVFSSNRLLLINIDP